MAATHSRISNDSCDDVFCDISRGGPKFPRRGSNARGLGIRANVDLNRGVDQRSKNKKIAKRDLRVLSQIVGFIVENESEAQTEAKRLLKTFGTIRNLFQQLIDKNSQSKNDSGELVDFLEAIAETFDHVLEQELVSGPIITSSESLRHYLFYKLSSVRKELFRVLFLDTDNRLIEDRLMGVGTVNRIQVYVREIVRDALELNATALILVHNHPCGDASPSVADIALTEEIIDLCHTFELEVLDHIVVSKGGIASFANLGLLHGSQSPATPESNLLNSNDSFVESCINSILKTFGKP